MALHKDSLRTAVETSTSPLPPHLMKVSASQEWKEIITL